MSELDCARPLAREHSADARPIVNNRTRSLHHIRVLCSHDELWSGSESTRYSRISFQLLSSDSLLEEPLMSSSNKTTIEEFGNKVPIINYSIITTRQNRRVDFPGSSTGLTEPISTVLCSRVTSNGFLVIWLTTISAIDCRIAILLGKVRLYK